MDTTLDIIATTADTFADDAAGFLDAMLAVWPECDGLRSALVQFNATLNCGVGPVQSLARRTAITKFHTAMAPFYARVRENDGSIFSEATSGMLADIRMADKWRDSTIDDTTRKAIFEWLQHMCNGAEMYSFYRQVPTTMLTRITGLAAEISNTNGDGVGLGGINPGNIGSLIQDIPEADMQEFAHSMMAQPGSMTAMMGMVGRLAGTPGAPGGVDLSAVMQAAGLGAGVPAALQAFGAMGGGGGDGLTHLADLAALQATMMKK